MNNNSFILQNGRILHLEAETDDILDARPYIHSYIRDKRAFYVKRDGDRYKIYGEYKGTQNPVGSVDLG
jgi:hypothetical protein